MKSTFNLLMIFAFASPAALAQTNQAPPGTQGSPAQSDFGMPPQQEITSPSMSGPSLTTPDDRTPAGASSGASGTSSQSQSGSTVDTSSGASNPMQSEAGMELRAAPGPTDRLKPVIHNDITYLCGGVGQEEVNYMKQEAKGYDMMLTFAARDGSYLTDVDVDIKDAKGSPVLQASCDSPIMLIDLPRSGTYKVHAEAAGYELKKSVKVAAAKRKGHHVASAVLVWPQQVAEAQGPAPTSGGGAGSSTGAGSDNK